MRVVHPDQHPQQGGRPGHRQGQGREPWPYGAQADRQGEGQGGVVAGEGPVARRGAGRERGDPGQGPAGTFLVDEEFDRLADSVRDHRPGGGHHQPGQARRLAAAQGEQPGPGQQQAEEQQRALARGFEEGPGPRGPVRHSLGERLVGARGGARGDPHRFVRARGAGGCQPDQGRRPRRGRGEGRRQAPGPSVSLDRFHAADARRAAARAPRPKGGPVPRLSSGLTGPALTPRCGGCGPGRGGAVRRTGTGRPRRPRAWCAGW